MTFCVLLIEKDTKLLRDTLKKNKSPHFSQKRHKKEKKQHFSNILELIKIRFPNCGWWEFHEIKFNFEMY